ncbi:homeobox protein CDX-2-like [Schistocerca americana]|uniref:homeobox protein CDX-2-like n=1 Tax=Schistocerca americana TaxID=7009 RepID=UPI001F50205B|nr:homeobox protein CDX-2-like [Schistocerca americana]
MAATPAAGYPEVAKWDSQCVEGDYQQKQNTVHQPVSDVDNGSDIVQRITAMLDTASAEQPSPSPPPALAGSTPGGSSGSASPTPPPALAGAPLHHAHPQHQALHHHHHHHPLSPLRSLSVAPPGVLPPQAHRSLSEGQSLHTLCTYPA